MKRRKQRDGGDHKGPRPNFRILSVYLLGVFIGALDTNILGPIFPSIAKSYHITLAWTAWTITAYTVAYIASTVLAGAIGDKRGHGRVFAWGIVAFGIASLLAATAPSFGIFILARVIQGLGAGAVYPNAQAEGIRQFGAERRGMALGIFGAVFGIASILGPTLGGAFGQFFGWPSVFFVNIPIAIIVLWAVRKLPASETNQRALPDVWGSLSFSGMLALFLLFVMVSSPVRVVFLAAALGLWGLFHFRQKHAQIPFLDTTPLRNKAGVAMMIGAALIGLDMSAGVFVPALAQKALHFSELSSGLALLPAAFAGAVFSGAGGVMTDRIGPRKVLVMGLFAASIGGILLAWPHMTFLRFMLAMVAFGIGTAFTMGAPLNRMALGLYREDQSGEALSLIAVFRSVGLASGPVILGAAVAFHGFTGMFSAVAIASLLGIGFFVVVPDVRPVRQGTIVESNS